MTLIVYLISCDFREERVAVGNHFGYAYMNQKMSRTVFLKEQRSLGMGVVGGDRGQTCRWSYDDPMASSGIRTGRDGLCELRPRCGQSIRTCTTPDGGAEGCDVLHTFAETNDESRRLLRPSGRQR